MALIVDIKTPFFLIWQLSFCAVTRITSKEHVMEFVITKCFPQHEIGIICSTRWSQALQLFATGTSAQKFPAKTAIFLPFIVEICDPLKSPKPEDFT